MARYVNKSVLVDSRNLLAGLAKTRGSFPLVTIFLVKRSAANILLILHRFTVRRREFPNERIRQNLIAVGAYCRDTT